MRVPHVLIVEDDPAIRTLLRRELKAAGYRVCEGEPAGAALQAVTERQFNVLILDIDTPSGGAFNLIRSLRARSHIPIIALSARMDEETAADALNSGADDFVRKPFGMKEALARIRNVLRRRAKEQGKTVEVVAGDLEIDLLRRRVHLRGREVHLSPKLFDVLRLLAEGAGRARTHRELLRAVWGPRQSDRQYLRLAIRQLRRKLEQDPGHPKYILTANTIGYRLEVRNYDELEAKAEPGTSLNMA